jgi:endogenous inhibitor of DNA gyrase (YacG/DUF329 family)
MRCPVCRKTTDTSSTNSYRPFCSERCHLTDLGTWAGEGYRVAGGKTEDHDHPDDFKKKPILH